MVALRPFISFYGGKWRATKHYPVPTHDRLIEPFAGGAGYALHYPERQVALFDIDPVIVSVWQYLIGVNTEEIMRLPLAFDSVDDLGYLPQEARWLIGFWLNKAVTAPRKTPAAWMRSGGSPSQYWGAGMRSRIASQVESIRHWTIQQTSYADVLPQSATWFIDPPYQGRVGRQYRYSDIDYGCLAEWVRTLPGQVIVCEQDGADWLPFDPLADIQVARGRSKEVIWLADNQATAEATA